MRILYTSASSDIRNNQRFETHFIEVAKNLVEIGNDLLILVTGYAPRDETNYDLNIKFIPSGRRRFLSYLWAEILRTFYLPYLIWKWKPGVIYTRRDRFEIFPPIWARLLKVPYVTEIHGIIEQESQIQKRLNRNEILPPKNSPSPYPFGPLPGHCGSSPAQPVR